VPRRDVLWQLTIDTQAAEQLTILSLAGRISHASVGELVTAFKRHGGDAHPVIVDLSGVDYVSSAGFHAFEQAARQLQAAGGALILCGLQDAVRPAFTLAGVIPALTVATDREAAIRHARAPTSTDPGR
jgi:anti-sigma B factor antagonist